MKAKVRSFSRITLVLMLSIVCCFSMFLAIGCGKPSKPGNQTTTESIFKEKQTTYVLSKDYQLTKSDETARQGAENEVKFNFATSFDLNGHTLDLNGRTLTIVSQEQGCVVTFTNGTVKGGTLNISVPNGDVEFTSVELTETVNYDLEAASNTIRMSNSRLKGSCTIKSNTHVEISQSSVENVTLDGNGTINVNQGSSLGNLEVSESATGATVNVKEDASVTGGLTLGAAANVNIAGSVAKVDVKETVVSTDDNKLNITVDEGAKVNQIDLKAAAEVSLAGEVDHVSVANENANVTVASGANVDKVEVKAAAEVKIEGAVANVVVKETATGAMVDVKDGAAIDNVVVAANDTEIKIANKDSVDKVKVVENVTGTVVPDDVTKEDITKDDVDEILAHVHDYTITRTEATCTEDGEIVYTCKTCTNVKKVKIKALGHDYKLKNTKEPTCTEDGEKVYACTREGCGSTYSEPVKALGHNYRSEVIKQATATEDGLIRYTCTRTGCGDTYDKVIKATGGDDPTITINSLSSLLRSILGDTFYFDVNGSYNLLEHYRDTYTDGELTSHEFEYFEITYIKKYEMYFDFTDDKQVTGYMFYDVKVIRLKSLEKVDFDNLESIEDAYYTSENSQYMYIQGDKIYIKQADSNSENGNNSFTSINDYVGISDFDMVVEYLKNDQNVPTPIKALANILDYVLGEGQEEIDMAAVKAKLEGIIEAIKNKDNEGDQGETQTPMSTVVINWIIENCFEVTTDDNLNGDTTYTLNLQKLKAALDNYGAMTISQYIDATNGEGTSAQLKEMLNLVPALDLNTLVSVVEGVANTYNLTLNDVYAVIDFAMTKMTGADFSTAAFVKEYGEMKLANVIYLTSNDENMTLEMAQQQVDAMVAQVIGMMDSMTVNDVLTTIMNMVKDAMPTPPADSDVPNTGDDAGNTEGEESSDSDTSGDGNEGGEEQPELTFMDYVDMLIEQYGEQISLVVVVKANGDVSYKLNALGYKVEFELGKAEDITFDLVVGTIEATMAHLNAIINETSAKVTVEVLDYTAKVDYDKTNSAFALVVTQKVETTNESTGEAEITENELAKLTFTNGADGFNVSLSVMGVEMVKVLGNKASGNMTLNIPMSESMMTAILTWTTVEGVTTVDLSVKSGEQEVAAMQLVVDNSVAGTYNVELTVGGHNEDSVYEKQVDLIKANVNTIVKDENVVGLQGYVFTNDYMLNQVVGNGNSGSNSDVTLNPSSSITTSYNSSSYQSKYNFKVMFNEKKSYDLTPVADVQAIFDKLYNVNAKNYSFGDYSTTESSIEYVQNDNEEYYLVKVVKYSANDARYDCGVYEGRLVVTTQTMRFPAENGYIKAMFVGVGHLCGDWYNIGILTSGLPVEKTENVYYGIFEREYYEDYPEYYKYVPTSQSSLQSVSTSSGNYDSSVSVTFVYNVKTKESYSTDTSSKNYELGIHNVEKKYTFDNGYNYCEAGVTVEYKCLDCGKTYTERRYSCDYELTNSYKLETSCGKEMVQVYTCRNCGDQEVEYLSYSVDKHDLHNFEYSSKDEETDYNVGTCSDCGLIRTETSECKQQDGQCVANINYVYTLNGQTLLEFTYKSKKHRDIDFDEVDYRWRSGASDNDITDEEANELLGTINEELGINLKLSDCEGVYKSVRKCSVHDKVFTTTYSFDAKNYYGHIVYEYSKCSKYLNATQSDGNRYGYRVDDISTYFADFNYDFSELQGVSAIMQIEGDLYGDWGNLRYTFYLDNKDEIVITYNSDSTVGRGYDNVSRQGVIWYHYNECKEYYYNFTLSADTADKSYTLSNYYVNDRHSYKETCLGDNCVEDGIRSECTVCHYSNQSENRYWHYSYSETYIDSTYNGMQITYEVYKCCGSYREVTIYLNSNVTLNDNMYILADNIYINLNGYTLDLNGYDLVLATYDPEEESTYSNGTVKIQDNGRYNGEENVYGGIVNTAEGGNGLLVLWSYKGRIDVVDVTIEADIATSDEVSRKEMQEYVKVTNSYDLTLNRTYFTESEKY